MGDPSVGPWAAGLIEADIRPDAEQAQARSSSRPVGSTATGLDAGAVHSGSRRRVSQLTVRKKARTALTSKLAPPRSPPCVHPRAGTTATTSSRSVVSYQPLASSGCSSSPGR
jgi:hypothetical protein